MTLKSPASKLEEPKRDCNGERTIRQTHEVDIAGREWGAIGTVG